VEAGVPEIAEKAGVGKGIYSGQALQDITQRMLKVLASHQVKIAAVYYCVHTDENNCDCRKPKPGMLLRALQEFEVKDPARVFFIGDAATDVQAGRNAGVRTILVLSGKTGSATEVTTWPVQPDFIASDLSEAAEIITAQTRPDHGKV
ncbi:MAG TPA: HAD-IIIA family hydrolase, partial [bacterium]|nr:HAD-IIIA family hydrolase [bacterium]